MPDHNVTLVARWTPGTANYRVVYWCEHTYDHGSYYIGAVDTRSGTVGDTATFDYLPESVAANAKLEFEKADQNVTIAADGSSVVNVYYRMHTVHVIVYKLDWNMDPNNQIIESEQDLRVGDDVDVPTTESMVLFFDDDQLDGTDPDTIDGVWGENITMRWTYYNPNVTGSSMQSHMRYYSTQPYVNPRGVDTTTWELKIYPDFRYSRSYPFYMAYYLKDPNTGEYELDTLYFEYRTDNSNPDNPSRTLRPLYRSGYSLKYVRYSTETYPADPTGSPSLGDFQEVSEDASGTAPEEQWYTQYYDPSNYIAFYYEPNDYALNYIVSGTTVHTESHPYTMQVGLDYVPEVPAELAAQGYTFAGWYQEGDEDQTIVDSTTISYEENNFVAKFQAPTYTVTFDLNGGTMSAATTQTIVQGGKATEPDPAPVREGYSFIGWFYQDTNGRYEFDKTVNSDVDLIAMWRAEPTQVSYIVRHVLDTGEVLGEETRTVGLWNAGYVSAFALSAGDAGYPSYPVVPDEICKALLLPDSGSNEIVFVYSKTPTHTYTVRYIDQASGLAVADDYVFEDFASIMTIAAPGFSGYVRLQDYGRGTADAAVITLYYRHQGVASPVKTSTSALPSTGDGALGMPWLAVLLLGAGCVAGAAAMSRRRDERI